MKYRILTKTIKKALRTFPAVVITGPRQSGKTTLLKNLLAKTHTYINLENPDIRIRAQDDPIGFLDNYKPPIIIDEIQYAPNLFSYIKTKIDEKRTPGQWVLTGSQNFVLMQEISQSLAGRAAILSLLPFSFSERINKGKQSVNTNTLFRNIKHQHFTKKTKKLSVEEIILRGSYPEIASNKNVDRNLWCGSYITTYLERDIRNLADVGDLSQFERFLRLCATRTGQILNISELAREVGLSVTTIKRWLSLLETGYQILLLYPYYRNIGKRMIKSPKLYFNDTALACYLLGLSDKKTLLQSPYFPHLLETLIVTDFWKRQLHWGELPTIYYLRTRDGLEVDLLVEVSQKLHLLEIKSSATITNKHISSLLKVQKELKDVQSASIISLSPDNFKIKNDIFNYNWQDILTL